MLTMQNVASKPSHGTHKLWTNSIIHRIQHPSEGLTTTGKLGKWKNGKSGIDTHSVRFRLVMIFLYPIQVRIVNKLCPIIKCDVDSRVVIFALYFYYGNRTNIADAGVTAEFQLDFIDSE